DFFTSSCCGPGEVARIAAQTIGQHSVSALRYTCCVADDAAGRRHCDCASLLAVGAHQNELVDAYGSVATYPPHGPHTLPRPFATSRRSAPGCRMALTGTRLTLRPSTVRLPTASGARERCSAPCSAERARNVAQLLIALLTLFFFYRDGDLLVRQIQRIAKRFFDDRSGSFRSRRWGYEPGGGFTGYSLRHWHK